MTELHNCAICTVIIKCIQKEVRRFNEVFHSDAHVYPIDTGDNRVLGIARDYKGKRMLGLFNFSPDEVWVDAWTGGSMMKPYGFRWILER